MKDNVFYNLDADATYFFERELEYNESEARRVEFPEYKYSKFFPVTAEAGPASEVISYEVYLKSLEDEETEAVHNCEYELAAEIRDKIVALKRE